VWTILWITFLFRSQVFILQGVACFRNYCKHERCVLSTRDVVFSPRGVLLFGIMGENAQRGGRYRLCISSDFGFCAKRPMFLHDARQRIILKSFFLPLVVGVVVGHAVDSGTSCEKASFQGRFVLL